MCPDLEAAEMVANLVKLFLERRGSNRNICIAIPDPSRSPSIMELPFLSQHERMHRLGKGAYGEVDSPFV